MPAIRYCGDLEIRMERQKGTATTRAVLSDKKGNHVVVRVTEDGDRSSTPDLFDEVAEQAIKFARQALQHATGKTYEALCRVHDAMASGIVRDFLMVGGSSYKITRKQKV